VSRHRPGEVNALAERLALASAAEAGQAWDGMDDDARAAWIAAWQPVALSLRNRRLLPVSESEVATIARVARQIASAGAEPPTRGLREAAQMVLDLRIRNGGGRDA